MQLFRRLVDAAKLDKNDSILLLSNDYLDDIVEFHVEQFEQVLLIVLPMPHGIYFVTSDWQWCVEVRMIGTAYLGRTVAQ